MSWLGDKPLWFLITVTFQNIPPEPRRRSYALDRTETEIVVERKHSSTESMVPLIQY